MKSTTFRAALLAAAALSLAASGCDAAGGKPRIGVALFSVDDSFVSTARRALEAESKGKAILSVLDGQNNQVIQNSQIEAMIEEKAKALIVNPVTPSTMGALVFRAKAAGTPIVFFSRDPSAVAVSSWDKAYFVGVKSEEAEALQVEMLADYWKSHPEADKDQDGRVDYVLLRGKTSRLDADASDDSRQRAFLAAGLSAAKAGEAYTDWSRTDGRDKMTGILAGLGKRKVEAVLCANDELALGAIEALKVAGYFRSPADYVPVLGVDGTRFALDAIVDGSLLGTVRGDAEGQGRAAFDLAYALAMGQDPASAGWPLTDGKFVLVSYRKVTKDNYAELSRQ